MEEGGARAMAGESYRHPVVRVVPCAVLLRSFAVVRFRVSLKIIPRLAAARNNLLVRSFVVAGLLYVLLKITPRPRRRAG